MPPATVERSSSPSTRYHPYARNEGRSAEGDQLAEDELEDVLGSARTFNQALAGIAPPDLSEDTMRNLLLANESLQATRKSLTDAISVSIAAAQPIIAIVKALEETQLPAHKKMLRVELDALRDMQRSLRKHVMVGCEMTLKAVMVYQQAVMDYQRQMQQ